MLQGFLVFMSAAAVSWFDLRPLRGKRKGKEIAIYILLMIAGGVLFSMELAHMSLPNPLKWAIVVFNPISKAIYAMLS